MLREEASHTCHKAVGLGHRLAVNVGNELDILVGIVLVEELGQVFGEETLEYVCEQFLAHYGTTTFVTQDETEGANVLHDLLTVVVARVSASTEDTSDTRLVTAYGASRCNQVAGSFDLRAAEVFGNCSRKGSGSFGERGTATCAIEIYSLDVLFGAGVFVGEDCLNLFAGHHYRVDARGKIRCSDTLCVYYAPLGFG